MTVSAEAATRVLRYRPQLPLALPSLAAALGAVAIGIQYLGTAHRPVASLLFLAAGVAAGVAPLRIGLPVAVVLSCFEGTILDFFGSPGRYWKEMFVALLVVRAVRRRLPSLRETAVAAVIGAVFLGYLLAGTPTLATGWAAKILLFAAVGGWGVARLGPGAGEWAATYYGLAVAIGANAVLGVWQRFEGWDGLHRLGLAYGERIRQTPGGELRAFGGFSGASPFAFVASLALLAWIGFFLSGRAGRRLAVQTAWLPPVALVGIVLTLHRIALVGLTVVAVLGILRHLPQRRAAAALGFVPLTLAGVLFAIPSTRQFLVQGITFRSHSEQARRVVWRQYGAALSLLGEGPGSAGAAYERTNHGKLPSVGYGPGWYPPERGPQRATFQWMSGRALIYLGLPGRRRRASVELYVASLGVPRRLGVYLERNPSPLAEARVPVDRDGILHFDVPGGAGFAQLFLWARPPGQRAPGDPRVLAVRLDKIFVADAGPPRTTTERIYARVRARLSLRALAGISPGVVDNLYLSWLYQYGLLLGAMLCAAWIVVLLRPFVRARADPLALTMQFWGLFVVVAAFVFNVWEEFPVDFLVALGFGQLYGSARTTD